MAKERVAADRQGKNWTVSKVRWEEAERADFNFWYEGLTPDQRVQTVALALDSCLKTQGSDGIPRLRRVHRRVKQPWGAVPHRRRSRSGLSRPTTRDKGS